jgi:penicillin-binding protein 1C
MRHENWFILPPTQAYYFQKKNPLYRKLPLYRNDCISQSDAPMEFVDNFVNQEIFLPKNYSGKTNSLIVKVNHRQPEIEIHWYIDNKYITTTKGMHELAIQPIKGLHILTVVDGFGNELKKRFKIL